MQSYTQIMQAHLNKTERQKSNGVEHVGCVLKELSFTKLRVLHGPAVERYEGYIHVSTINYLNDSFCAKV